MSQETSSCSTFWAKSNRKTLASLAALAALTMAAAPAFASRIVAYPGFPQDGLGKAVDTISGKIGGPCLSGEPVLARRPHVQAKLHFNQTNEELFHHVFGTGSAGINAGILGASQAVEFSRQLGINENSSALVLEISYHHGSLLHKHPARLTGCNGPYAAQLNIGARLLVGVAMEFDTRDQKDRFVTETSVSILWGAVKKKKQSVKEIEKFTSNARLKVKTLLLGGESEALAALGPSKECPPDLKAPCFDYSAKVLDAFAGTAEFSDSVERSLSRGQYFVTSIVVKD